jgi:ABC-type branched-subunit amino acid transport system substrate-binding protein
MSRRADDGSDLRRLSLKRPAAVVAAGAAIALASGCASSHPVSGAGDSAARGAAINVMMESQVTGATFGAPESVDAAQAIVKQINSSGGIKGTKVNLIVCDDKESPNVAASCARTAISDHVAAVIAGISINAPAALPILQAAHIPWITVYPVTPLEYTSPDSFPLTGGSASLLPAQGAYIGQRACTKVGVVADATTQAQASADQMVAGIEASGGTVVSRQTVSTQTADVAPAIATILHAGAKCLGEAVTPAETVKVLAAVHQSSDPGILQVSQAAILPAALLPVVGAAANGVAVISGPYLPTDARLAEFHRLMAPYGTKDLTPFAEYVWGGFEYFADVAKQVPGQVTGASLLAQLPETGPTRLDILPEPVSFQTPGPVHGFDRIVNLESLAYEVQNGSFVLAQSATVSAKAGLQKYASSH